MDCRERQVKRTARTLQMCDIEKRQVVEDDRSSAVNRAVPLPSSVVAKRRPAHVSQGTTSAPFRSPCTGDRRRNPSLNSVLAEGRAAAGPV